jgi:hypothetical protein
MGFVGAQRESPTGEIHDQGFPTLCKRVQTLVK